jgi:hypothetical protein
LQPRPSFQNRFNRIITYQSFQNKTIITSKETVVEKNWLEKKKHQINPQTEVDTSSNEEPSCARDDSNPTMVAAMATGILLKKGKDIKSAISRLYPQHASRFLFNPKIKQSIYIYK